MLSPYPIGTYVPTPALGQAAEEPPAQEPVIRPMLATLSRHQSLRILIVRALVLFVLIRVLVSPLRIDTPIGVVLLVAALGWIDLRRRHESLFWANLGYSTWQTTGVFAGVALVSETLVSIVVEPLVQLLTRLAR